MPLEMIRRAGCGALCVVGGSEVVVDPCTVGLVGVVIEGTPLLRVMGAMMSLWESVSSVHYCLWSVRGEK